MFEGKNALVVGGSGGIGREVSRRLCALGANVAVHGSRPSKKFDALVSELSRASKERGSRVEQIALDFFSESFSSLFSAEPKSPLVESAERADILCVCFGPFLQKPVEKTSAADWERMALMNYALPGALVSAALPSMVEKRWGRVLLFGGTGTASRREFLTNAAYAGAKAGVSVIVESTALSYARFGVTCNAIMPGFTETEYTDGAPSLARKMPTGALLRPEAVADAAVSLMKSPDVNGALLRMDGGWSPLSPF